MLPQPLNALIQDAQAYLPPETDLRPLEQAYEKARALHDAARARKAGPRPEGQPPLEHGAAVARILAGLKQDVACLQAGLLHDVLEEQLCTLEQLRASAGDEVATLVQAVSALNRAAFRGNEAARAEHMREMILASTRDLRVILLLLADRLDTLRGAAHLPPPDRKGLARETQVIFAPIAHRLGIHTFKSEMEDLAFCFMQPDAFERVRSGVQLRVGQHRRRIAHINEQLTELLKEHGLDGEVLGRAKHLYSVHAKMQRNKVDLDQIHDLLATRIIVPDIESCYRVLGLIHARYTPIPGRFKDYIALPKENGYQSLHTQVFGSEGDIFEIQIRTREMHEMAEMGIAAHFAYKQGHTADEKELASIAWFRRLLENLQEGQDPGESLDLLERDLTPEEIFVFTPSGEVIKLPHGATPIDFAYAVHSQVGSHCTGAKVDGRMISIRTPLRTGNVVEILTSNNQTPKEDWLNYAVSSKALSRIRSFLRNQEKDEAVRLGKEAVARELRPHFRKVEDLFAHDQVSGWLKRHNLNTPDELYAAEGFGRVSLKEGLERIFPPEGGAAGPDAPPRKPAAHPPPRKSVSISGLDNLMTRFAKCCNPLQGDPVVGIITRGRGISIHHRHCRNLQRKAVHPDRLVQVDWGDEFRGEAQVTLSITARSTMKDMIAMIGMLEDEEKTPISSGRITSRHGVYTQVLTLKVRDSRQLKRILTRLNAQEGVQAERVFDAK